MTLPSDECAADVRTFPQEHPTVIKKRLAENRQPLDRTGRIGAPGEIRTPDASVRRPAVDTAQINLLTSATSRGLTISVRC
jgi:hypothetical protein